MLNLEKKANDVGKKQFNLTPTSFVERSLRQFIFKSSLMFTDRETYCIFL